jgi:hypothetical protein
MRRFGGRWTARGSGVHHGKVKAVERAAYIAGVLLIASGLAHAAVLVASGGSWDGPLSMRKPATFGLSFGLTLINVTLIASFVALADRTRTRLLAVFAAACIVETLLISLQAWRGVPSHFNMETTFDAVLAQILAVGGVVLVAVIVFLTVAAFRDRAALPPAVRLAIRAGLLALAGAQLVGGVMIFTGVRLVVAGDPQLAYAAGGWLKPVHAVLMHGILVLPLLAWGVSRTDWVERTQLRAVWTGIAVYALLIIAALAASISVSNAERGGVRPGRRDQFGSWGQTGTGGRGVRIAGPAAARPAIPV